MIPTDLFRYCHADCTLEDSMIDFNYPEQVRKFLPDSGDWTIEQTGKWDGMIGRIPCKLFEALVDTPKLLGVFRTTRFCAFVNLQGDTFTRGIKYPPDLFKYNTRLEDITGMFSQTILEVGVDVNSDLFANNPNLKLLLNCGLIVSLIRGRIMLLELRRYILKLISPTYLRITIELLMLLAYLLYQLQVQRKTVITVYFNY